jgi:3-deoxy-D-manno-octulosonic-acid transferase
MLYAAADVAFVGGSLVPIGGHNLLEPAAAALPIVTGPHNFNAEDIVEMLGASGAAAVISRPEELAAEIGACLRSSELRRQRGAAGRHILDSNRGALDRLIGLVMPLMESSPGQNAQASL